MCAPIFGSIRFSWWPIHVTRVILVDRNDYYSTNIRCMYTGVIDDLMSSRWKRSLFFSSDYAPRYKFIMLHILEYRAFALTNHKTHAISSSTLARSRVDCAAALFRQGKTQSLRLLWTTFNIHLSRTRARF